LLIKLKDTLSHRGKADFINSSILRLVKKINFLYIRLESTGVDLLFLNKYRKVGQIYSYFCPFKISDSMVAGSRKYVI